MSLVYKMMKHFQLSTLLLIIIAQPIFPWCKTLASAQVLHHGCLEKCGDVEIPYPFGTNEGCYFNSDFFIMNCKQNASVSSPLLFLGNSDSENEVINIFLDGRLRIFTSVAKECFNKDGTRTTEGTSSVGLSLGSFPVSNTHNKFTAVGCDTLGVIAIGDTATGCVSICSGNTSLVNITYDGTCSGIGCCQITIPENHRGYGMAVSSLNNHTKIWDYNPCS
ncbi:hypothetical protein QQ045_006170 [Rhodiola kirilowii]